MLHLLSQLPLQAAVIERIGNGDDVVLMDSAVCAAVLGHQDNQLLTLLLASACRVFALREMLAVHGVEPGRIMPNVTPVDCTGLVELTVQNPVIHSWC